MMMVSEESYSLTMPSRRSRRHLHYNYWLRLGKMRVLLVAEELWVVLGCDEAWSRHY
jgi:hypothetical protein